jgi:type I restriction enzyme S subunit
VVVRTGQAGAAAVIPDELDGANCIDLLIVRRSRVILPGFLEHFLNSATAVRAVAEESVGSIQAHYNVGALKRLPVPVPAMAEQQSLLAELDAERHFMDITGAAYERQITLLRERREALISAAVTGHLDVTTARGAA